jgi:hypothetical protein
MSWLWEWESGKRSSLRGRHSGHSEEAVKTGVDEGFRRKKRNSHGVDVATFLWNGAGRCEENKSRHDFCISFIRGGNTAY